MSVTARQVAVRALVPGVPGRLGLQQRRRLLLLLLLLATSGDGHRSARSADRPDICITTRHQSVTSHAFTAVESEIPACPPRRHVASQRPAGDSALRATVRRPLRGPHTTSSRQIQMPKRLDGTPTSPSRRVAPRLVSSRLASGPLSSAPPSRVPSHASHVTCHASADAWPLSRSVGRSVGRRRVLRALLRAPRPFCVVPASLLERQPSMARAATCTHPV